MKQSGGIRAEQRRAESRERKRKIETRIGLRISIKFMENGQALASQD